MQRTQNEMKIPFYKKNRRQCLRIRKKLCDIGGKERKEGGRKEVRGEEN